VASGHIPFIAGSFHGKAVLGHEDALSMIPQISVKNQKS
jgi:hypothetical protein